MYDNGIEKILINEDEISKRVKELGKQISEDYKDSKDFLVIGILKGSVVFMADLIRNIDIHTSIDFMTVSSYGSGTISSGVLTVKKDLDTDIEGKDILIAEDIIDSGITLFNLIKLLKERNPKSIKICTFLNKAERREVDMKVDYIGFDIPNEFIVGYGLDYAEKYRNFPYVGILKREVYENNKEAEN